MDNRLVLTLVIAHEKVNKFTMLDLLNWLYCMVEYEYFYVMREWMIWCWKHRPSAVLSAYRAFSICTFVYRPV